MRPQRPSGQVGKNLGNSSLDLDDQMVSLPYWQLTSDRVFPTDLYEEKGKYL